MPQLIYQVPRSTDAEPAREPIPPRNPISFDLGGEANRDWFLNTTDARIALAEQIGPSRLVFRINLEDKPAYVIHGARSENFLELSGDAGIPVGPGERFAIAFSGFTTADAQASMMVLEYDEDRKRSGTFSVPLKSAVTYEPGAEVRHVVVAIRLAGKGKVTVTRISAQRLTDGAAPAPRFPSTDAARPALSDEADQWRRRAHDWEARYYEAHSEFSRPSARLGHAALLQLADTIPESNGSRYFAKLPVRLAIVTDIYMYNFYKDACEQVEYLSPTDYRRKFDENDFDALLFVSCWVGKSGEEWKGIAAEGEAREAFEDILGICGEREIPTIFQSIEDPSNYERFLPIARQMEHIFTSDSESIDRYRRDCGHDRVHQGEFGYNPLVNNPIGSRLHTIESAFFAGSYPSGYASRCKDMDVLFGAILESGGELVIADRNYWRGAASQRFPVRFQPHIIAPIDHLQLQKVHKLFRYNLNFNSVQASPTMCAMRVSELLAQGRTLWSNYARSLVETFPEIQIIPYPQRLDACFAAPETEREYQADLARMRSVLADKASFEIVARMLAAAGFDVATPDPLVGLVGPARSAETAARLGRHCGVRTMFLDEAKMSGGWGEAAREYGLDYAAWLSPELDYADCYLQDLVNGFKFTDSRYVTAPQLAFGKPDFGRRAHNYTGWMPGRERTLFALSEIALERIADFDGPRGLKGGYAIDPFGVAPASAPAPSPAVSDEADLAMSVIIPVAEGTLRALAAKTLPSILRNRRHRQIERLLINGGAEATVAEAHCRPVVEAFPELALRWCDDDGADDRAGRRNAGIEAARGRLVTFLDAGSEISPGGYDALIETEERTGGTTAGPVDFVCGFEVLVGAVNAVRGKQPGPDPQRIDDPASHFLGAGTFPAIPTQALAVRREWLAGNPDLRFAADAVDQDSLFGWTLLRTAAAVCFTRTAHVLRYERGAPDLDRIDDPTELLAAERERRARLESLGLLESYAAGSFGAHFRDWYLRKAGPRRAEFAAILRQIVELYGEDPGRFGL